jgi:hypothetical protein
MARKAKPASFEIPDAVRRSGQSGWVYRTGTDKARSRHAAPAPRRAPTAPAPPAVLPPAAAECVAPEIVPAGSAAAPVAGRTLAGRLVGFSLHVAAVPFVVPLYLTAAVSRRLGFTSPQ